MKRTKKNQKLIEKQWIHSLSIEGLEVDIIIKIKITREKNKEIVRVVEKIKKIEVKVLRGDK